jgi:hypothetical protein
VLTRTGMRVGSQRERLAAANERLIGTGLEADSGQPPLPPRERHPQGPRGDSLRPPGGGMTGTGRARAVVPVVYVLAAGALPMIGPAVSRWISGRGTAGPRR